MRENKTESVKKKQLHVPWNATKRYPHVFFPHPILKRSYSGGNNTCCCQSVSLFPSTINTKRALYVSCSSILSKSSIHLRRTSPQSRFIILTNVHNSLVLFLCTLAFQQSATRRPPFHAFRTASPWNFENRPALRVDRFG